MMKETSGRTGHADMVSGKFTGTSGTHPGREKNLGNQEELRVIGHGFLDQRQQMGRLIETTIEYELELGDALGTDPIGKAFPQETGRPPQGGQGFLRLGRVLHGKIYGRLGEITADPDLGNGQVAQARITYLPHKQGGKFPLNLIGHPFGAAKFPRHFET